MRIRRDTSVKGRIRRGLWVGAVMAAAVVWGPQAIASGDTEPGAVSTYTVVSGETMWSIASSITAPGGDVWGTVDKIAHLNGIKPSELREGQQIVVPVLG